MSLSTSKILIFVHVAGDVFVAVNENGELSSVGHILPPSSISLSRLDGRRATAAHNFEGGKNIITRVMRDSLWDKAATDR